MGRSLSTAGSDDKRMFGTVSDRFYAAIGVGRPENTFDNNNAISVFLMGALPAVAGSAISFLLGTFFVWGVFSLWRRRFPFRLTRSDRAMAGTFSAFALLNLVCALLAENPLQAFTKGLWLLPFLSLWVVIPRLRASPTLDYLKLYIAGAVVGCFAALAIALIQLGILGMRVSGGAGNAAVFAVMCLCLTGMAGLAIDARRRSLRLVALVAMLAGSIAIAPSLSRSTVLALVPVLILLFFYAPGRWRTIALHPVALVALGGAGLLLYTMWDVIDRRFLHTLWEVGQLLSDRHTTSIGERFRLWNVAWQAFKDAPVWGYGFQNRMDVVNAFLAQDGLRIYEFSHPHNGFLAAALDGGVVVLASLLVVLAMPVAVAWRAPRDEAHRRRLFLALIVSVAYALTGLANIIFKHDILDSFYIFTAIVVAASIPSRGSGTARRPQSPPDENFVPDQSA